MSALALATPGRRVWSAQVDFGSWPRDGSPQEIGARVAQRFLATPMPAPLMNEGTLFISEDIPYWETCAWYGALTFARLAQDEALTKKLIARFETLLGPKAGLIPTTNGDSAVFGAVPFELYIQTRDARYLPIGKKIADRQWAEPPPLEWFTWLKPEQRQISEQAVKDGLSPQTRFWVDDMYVITLLQVQAFRATGKPIYLDRAAREMIAHLTKLQQPNGLFFHSADAPFFWGRGNGWVAAGMTELLRTLSADHPDRPRITASYRKMMATLLKYQDENGMWRQLIDHPEAWPETSCTGMFTFAFVTGVKEGWIDAKTYAPAARKGWLGLVKHLNEDADITEVCEGTNATNDYKYYINRRRNVGDLHGQAPILWSASAFLR